MEVSPGYKLTEVGVIPEDWNIKPFGKVFHISGGLSASRAQLSDTGYCYLHYGDIHTSPKSYVDVDLQHSDLPKLNIRLADVSKKSLLLDGDVVFVDASEDDEGTSKHQVILNPNNIPFISGLHTIVAKSKGTDLSKEYKCHCFKTQSIKKQFLFYCVGTKVSGISKKNISNILIPLPPGPEQRAIAAALSDADALLAGLNALIAKKRLVRQGAMQELLTGKRRLPGYGDKWKQKTIGEVLKLCYGKSQQGIAVEGGRFPIIATSGEVGRTNQFLYDKPSVIIGRKGTIDIPQYVETPFWTIDTAYYSEISNQGNAKFLFYLLTTINWYLYNEASGVPSLNANTVGNIEISLPSLPEQQAIAEVLNDMDAEIAALEGKLVKARQVKQGMMQELLTGRIRLL